MVAGKRYPWASLVRNTDLVADDLASDDVTTEMAGVGISFHHRGFHLPFENGWVLSVIWGSGSYSINHDAWHPDDPFVEESPDAEIAVYFKEQMIDLWGECVRGYMPAREVRTLIDTMMVWPSNISAVRALLASAERLVAEAEVD